MVLRRRLACRMLVAHLVSKSQIKRNLECMFFCPVPIVFPLTFAFFIFQTFLNGSNEVFDILSLPTLHQEVIDQLCPLMSRKSFSNFDPVQEVDGCGFLPLLVLDLSLENLHVNGASGLTEVSLKHPVTCLYLFFAFSRLIEEDFSVFLH